MSNLLIENRTGLIKTVTILTAVATVLSLSGVLSLTAFAVTPGDYGLTEGNTISAAGSDDPDVYIVNDWGYKRLFLSPQIFNLYGHLGGFANVKNVSPATRDAFGTSGLFRVDGDEKVYGLETTGEDIATLHWVNTTGAQAVADDANFFKKVFVINAAEFALYSLGYNYTSVNQVPVYVRGGSLPGQPAPGVGLGATLAGPASSTLVAGQGLGVLANFNVSGSGAVTSVQLQRLGISGDTTPANVFLFVNGKRVSEAGTVASGVVTFNDAGGLFTAPAMLEVRSDIAASTEGQTVGMGLRMLNSTSLNVNGNLHTIAAKPSNLETVAVGTPTGPGNVDPQLGVNVWQSTLTISNKNVYLKRLTLRDVGSVNASDIKNFKLFVDGVQIATAEFEVSNAGKHVHFVLGGTGHLMTTGARIARVEADVIGGSSRTFRFGLRGAYDLESVGSNYGVSILPTGTFPAQPAASTINAGSVTVEKASDSPASDLVVGGTDVVLGRFTMTAYGESIKVDTLTVMATSSDTGATDFNKQKLRNVRLLFNGTQYGSTTNVTTNPSATGQSFTTNYVVNPGSPVTVEVRGDLKNEDGDNIAADKTIKVTLKTGDSNALGQVSAEAKNVPTADKAGNELTVKSGAMTLSKYQALSNQTVTIPASNLLLGQWTLTGDASEDITLNTVKLGFNVGGAWIAALTTDVRVEIDGVQFGTVKPTISTTASHSYSGNLTLAKNQTRNIKVYANVGTFTVADSDDTMTVEMNVTGITAVSGTTVYGPSETGQTIGQTMTAGSGTFTTAVASGNPSQFVAAGNTTRDALKVSFTSQNDTFTIKTLRFKVDNANAAGTVSSVRLLDHNGAIVTSVPMTLMASGSYYANFLGLTIAVPNNEERILTAQLMFGTIGLNAATSSANAKLTMTSVVRANSQGVETTVDTDRAGNNVYVHKSYPSVVAVSLPSTVLAASGPTTASKFTISANTGTVAIKKLVWDITRSEIGVKFASTTSSGKLLINGVDVTTDLGGSTPWVYADHVGVTGSVSYIFTDEYQVSVGSPITVEYRPDITTVPAGASTLVTKLDMGNSAVAQTGVVYADAAVVGLGSRMVWSDRSGASGTIHSQLTADWFNDHLLKDSISQTLSK